MGCREVIKYGLLQQKVLKKTSTLRRKKKYLYQEALWVALCVHDQKIPFIEWYRTEEQIRNHEPFKVLDLLYASYITNVITDDRCFVIGFKTEDVEPIELAALDNRQRQEWVSFVHDTLARLGILKSTSNVYGECVRRRQTTDEPSLLDTSLNSPTSSQQTSPRLDDTIPLAIESRPTSELFTFSNPDYEHISSVRSVLRMEEREVSRDNTFIMRHDSSGYTTESSNNTANGIHVASSPPSVSIRPPLPPRKADSATELPASVTNSNIEDGLYDLPRSTAALVLYDSLSPLNTPNVSNSPMTSTMSTTSLCSSSNDSRASSDLPQERHADFRLSSIIPPPSSGDFLDEPNQYSQVRRTSEHVEARGYSQPLRKVSVNLTTLVEHLLFVEVGGRVWISGWTESHDKQLACFFRVGDELVEVEDHPVNGMHNIPQLFYTLSTPGTPVNLHIRPLPNAVTYRLVKPINHGKPIGIELHKKKNRIENIIEDSPAFRRSIPREVPSFFHPENRSPAVITEVNTRRLNLFAKNDQPFRRIDQCRDGMEFTITLQPHDFVKEVKNQMRQNKHFKAFLCE